MPTPATINILESASLVGSLQFIGSNSVGPQIQMTLDTVLIKPAAALNMIHDEWGQLHLDGEVLANISTGSFGEMIHPDTTLTSPNTGTYYIGKGIVSWQPAGTNGFRDIGNVPIFEFQPEVKVLDHFSSRLGIKTKDKTVVSEKSAKIKVVMDEWTYPNLLLVLMGV